MSYDDVKTFRDETYSGMRVGGRHVWRYEGTWDETKVSPQRWEVRFEAVKRRTTSARSPDAPVCMRCRMFHFGACDGTMYHWFLIGHQRVRKVDEDSYQTLFEAQKWKIGHKRPNWRSWQTEYDGQESARRKTLDALREALEALSQEEEQGADRLERRLSPVPDVRAPPRLPVRKQSKLGI